MFPLQQLLCERAAVLCYTYTVAGEILLLWVLIQQYSIKPNDTEDSFPDDVEQVFCQFRNFHAINFLEYFTESIGIEDTLIFKAGLESWHEVHYCSGFYVAVFAAEMEVP